ncbi:OmpA family protein [Parachryseolinea silvisoli]|uniref:OmpA family protein n=1 Tax=Parachryseolinea silvisoli TaxID=2873601 RepID=UPI002265B3CA|nr:OmpA family protein [Parachryseolinea silvisoli]MCD9019355.1 OmpA family protein [Parachryseolinea silvisoli]
MRKSFALALIVGFASISSTAFSQTPELSPGYYLVVGAYAKTRESAAQAYMQQLKQQGKEATYGFNTGRGLYFVYLQYFTTLRASLLEMTAVRKQEAFKDAWIRVVPGDIAALQPPGKKTTITPVVEAPPAPATTPSENQQEPTTPPGDSIVVTDNPEIVQYKVMTLGNTEVFLSVYNARNDRIVDGTVQVIDTDRAHPITRVKGNEYLNLPDPKSKSGQLTLICDIFGYRKLQQEINYPLPLADTVKPYIDLVGTTVVINFDMVRYHPGDIATLYNVYFYNDAAIMQPESKYEINSLLQLMQENSRYRIRLHGHTNGNYHGKLLTIGPDKKFFSLDGAKQSTGSAKDLSRHRADVIKEYLVANGIDASRIEIKAWGGKRPLYDKRSANAKKNVRVEVEILEE